MDTDTYFYQKFAQAAGERMMRRLQDQIVRQMWPIIATRLLPNEYQQIKFPRSKKKRIRKKWRKNTKYWEWGPSRTLVQRGNVFYAHPDTIRRMKRASNAAGE